MTPSTEHFSSKPSQCLLCHGTHLTELAHSNRNGGALRTVICEDCGLVFSDPFPHDPRSFYQDEYRLNYKGTYQPKAKHVLRAGQIALTRHAKIRNYLQTAKTVLDVGAGGGEFAYLLKQRGHHVSGIEPNLGYAHYARDQYDLNLNVGFIQDTQFPDNSFDLITIWHVLEHTENPLAVLKSLCTWLKADGILVVEVPNVEATCQSPNSTFHDAHLFNFNTATLSKMAEKAGLTLQSHQFSADGGNLTVFLGKKNQEQAMVDDWTIPGNAEQIRQIVSRHTPWRHFRTLKPYRRLLLRVLRSFKEKQMTRNTIANRELLDRLYSGI